MLTYAKIDRTAKVREAQLNVVLSENYWVARKRIGTPLSERLVFISVNKSFRIELLMVTVLTSDLQSEVETVPPLLPLPPPVKLSHLNEAAVAASGTN